MSLVAATKVSRSSMGMPLTYGGAPGGTGERRATNRTNRIKRKRRGARLDDEAAGLDGIEVGRGAVEVVGAVDAGLGGSHLLDGSVGRLEEEAAPDDDSLGAGAAGDDLRLHLDVDGDAFAPEGDGDDVLVSRGLLDVPEGGRGSPVDAEQEVALDLGRNRLASHSSSRRLSLDASHSSGGS